MKRVTTSGLKLLQYVECEAGERLSPLPVASALAATLLLGPAVGSADIASSTIGNQGIK